MTTNSCDLEKERNSVSECSKAERESEWTHERYVKELQQFIVYPPEKAQEYLECLLFSEIGEVVGVHAKYVRGDFDEAEYKRRLIGELGDVLFAASLLLGDMTVEPHPDWPDVNFPIDAAWVMYEAYFVEDSPDFSSKYIAYQLAKWLSIPGITIEQLREANVKKLQDRFERNKIRGDGDER